jgi:hypothetical protein
LAAHQVSHQQKWKPQKLSRFYINGRYIENTKDIAESFNKFFVNIGQVLDDKIPHTNAKPTQFIPKNYNINIFLNPATETEVSKIISNLKECATGWDNVPACLIKDNSYQLQPVLTHIINASLSSGIFLRELKMANVIPLFKSGDSEQITNYRPVSLLTTLSKIYENFFYNRLLNFLKAQNILFKSQYGFRENNSTFMAMINLLDTIIEAIDNGKMAIGIFIDFSKAFDTVNHKILIDKLEHYGVRGVAKKWVSSYLEKRKQYCTYMGSKSEPMEIKSGVPQGSILGPLLFLLYISDLGNIFNKLTPVLFADDSNLIVTGKNIKEIEDNAKQELPRLIEWLNANRLSLNIKKLMSWFSKIT